MNKCTICKSENLTELLDFDKQPVCHKFLSKSLEGEVTFDIALGQCLVCGTLQLTKQIPAKEVKPRYDWLTCTEPEEHLDDLVDRICKLPRITKESTIAGVSFKDNSTLERLKKRGYGKTWRINPTDDLGIEDPLANVETLQDRFGEEEAHALKEKHGGADIVICRHVLEHAYDVRGFIEACKGLLNPNGYLILEVPDCQRALENNEYTAVWEEHLVYFTEETFRNVFGLGRLSLVHFQRESYPIEDSYVGISQISSRNDQSFPEREILEKEKERALLFANTFSETKKRLFKYFTQYRETKGKIVLFGGGHMGCTFINIMGLKDLFEFVADDNPNMRGLFMPGSHLPILNSQEILKQDIKLCLLTLSFSSEEKVIKKNQEFIKSGGIFASVFPGSDIYFNA